MTTGLSRRDLLKVLTVQGLAALTPAAAEARRQEPGWVTGQMTGAEALVQTLKAEGVECVFGIPGAQQNELWDMLKTQHLPYVLVTHEFSAAAMADGYARSLGKPGVMCVVPGPGLTNALSGLGEALLDSVPLVCIVGDVANGANAHAFQVHCLNHAALLRPVTKEVLEVRTVAEIPGAVRMALQLAASGEPGPVGVIVPYNLLIQSLRQNSGPLAPCGVPFDENAFQHALALLCNRRLRVGIYAGLGCMDYSEPLTRLAEVLQAPVATSIAGKGVIPETHPLAVGWGYGPHGTRTAENAFANVDVILAIGVKFSEVSTGFYSQPQPRHLIHVDINANNLGRVMRTEAAVHADAGLFLHHLHAHADHLRRPTDERLMERIRQHKEAELRINQQNFAQAGVDPMAFLLALRRCTAPNALVFCDVTVSQYWAIETFTSSCPRTFFNPTNNQSMGWSIPAALGAQKVNNGRQVVTITGDGCFLMSGMEVSTAARERLPVKFFVLDDQAYEYMQRLQEPAYLRTTATILARLDYRALAQGWGLAYQDISPAFDLDASLQAALAHDGPLLVRVGIDYRRRPVRWIDNARRKYTNELTPEQKVRFLARIGSRALDLRPRND